MDCTSTDVFSPIRNFDEKKINRQSDGFSEILKGPDTFKKKSVNSEILDKVDENTPVNDISKIKSIKTPQKKTAKYEVFSPIRNFDEEKINRQSDGFSEFLKGPDIFKKKSVNSGISENADENTPVNNISNIKSSKTHQKKTSKHEIYESEKEFTPTLHDFSFIVSPEKSSSITKHKSKNVSNTSKKNDKLKSNQKSEAECKIIKTHDSRSGKKNSVNLVKTSLQSGIADVNIASESKEIKRANDPSSVSQHNKTVLQSVAAAVPIASGYKEMKRANDPSSVSQHNKTALQSVAAAVSIAAGYKEMKRANDPSSVSQHNKTSLQSGAAAVPIASGSKEIKKANEPSSVSQHNPLSQMKSGVLEKMINDAVESQVDEIRQTMWSHHLNLLKAINNVQDEMELRRAENITLFKIIEQLLEENLQLRTAVLARQ